MESQPLHLVTGALGYTGKAITEQLLERSIRVRTLTNSPDRQNPFGDRLDIRRMDFDDHQALVGAFTGVSVFYNTYWVRFNHKGFNFEQGIANSKKLFVAAKEAGVEKIVHVSILHADQADDLGYYKGKHELEDAIKGLGVPYALVRPGAMFGGNDILINNIAWTLRRLPIFGTFGDGSYRMRPIHVEDMASLMIEQGQAAGSATVDAVGPESYTYKEFVELIGSIVGISKPIFAVPPVVGYWISKLVNAMVQDVVITREEIKGLMRGLLDSDQASTGTVKLSAYIEEHEHTLGKRYANEIKRRTDRLSSYDKI